MHLKLRWAHLQINTAVYSAAYILANVGIYFDKNFLYDPAYNGQHVSKVPHSPPPHLSSVVAMAKILCEAHVPHSVVTNITLDQLPRFRAVIVPNVLEITPEQGEHFRNFVRNGGMLLATGPSFLQRESSTQSRFLLEDVLGVRYAGLLGKTVTYLSPKDALLNQAVWPQDAVTFAGQMIHVDTLPDAQILATVTLPFVDPTVGNSVNLRYAQIHCDPPATPPGSAPGIVQHSFGRGNALWIAAPVPPRSRI